MVVMPVWMGANATLRQRLMEEEEDGLLFLLLLLLLLDTSRREQRAQLPSALPSARRARRAAKRKVGAAVEAGDCRGLAPDAGLMAAVYAHHALRQLGSLRHRPHPMRHAFGTGDAPPPRKHRAGNSESG